MGKNIIKVNCIMCGREIEIINQKDLDIKKIICNKHKGEDMANFMIKDE